MALVLGVDGGNSKTDLAVATLSGAPCAYVRGPGTNAHALGAEQVARVVGALLAASKVAAPVLSGALFLCGADLPSDHDELATAFATAPVAADTVIANDTFAILHAGRRQSDAVAVVCGAGINVVGEAADGRTVQYPGLGWESGDWGGAEMLGREALFLAARAEDGRGQPSVLPQIIATHFAMSVAALGSAIHYRQLPAHRLGELAPALVAAADHDPVVARLIDRLVGEVVKMARRALADLDLLERPADVVLGGGMLTPAGPLFRRCAAELARCAPHATPLRLSVPPVLGALLVALRRGGGDRAAAERLRTAFAELGAPVPLGTPGERVRD